MQVSRTADPLPTRALPWLDKRWFALLCLLWVGTAVGCFERTYAERLKTTVKYYDHLDLLNRNLAPESGDMGFRLRVPKGFEFIPKPVPPPPDPENPQPPASEETLADPRQPGYLSVTLPGMVAAWQKPVNVDENGMAGTRKAYLYLLSNAYLFAESPETPGHIDPTKYHKHVLKLLSDYLRVELKDEEIRREDFPAAFSLVPKVTYDSVVLLPEGTFEETKMSFKLYSHSQGDMQTIVLLVYPDSTSAGEKLTDRMSYSLETLRVPASASTSAPAPGAPTANGATAL